jgi:hypothetical protein
MKLRRGVQRLIMGLVAFILLLSFVSGWGDRSPFPKAIAKAPPADLRFLTGGDGGMTPKGLAELHLRFTPEQVATPEDQAQADRLVEQIREALAPYRDVAAAEAAGYHLFPPNSEDLPIQHYTNPWLSALEGGRFSPEEPGSLLYERQNDGSLQLLGAMYGADEETPLNELNNRIPLSVARWHQHINICIPYPIWDEAAWARQENGRPVFGPDSPIATEAACQHQGGEFLPTVFGWMIHANVFAANAHDIWNPLYGMNSGPENNS